MSSGRQGHGGGDDSGRSGPGSSSNSSVDPDSNLIGSSEQARRRPPRVDTGLLAPARHNNDQGSQPPSPSQPLTPTVREEDPCGKTRVLHPDGDTESRMGGHDEIHQYRKRSGSESSFASIKSVEDLGFMNHVAASDRAIGQGSGSLSPTTARHSRSDSNSSINGRSLQKRLSVILRDHFVKSQCHDKDFLPISDIENIISTENVHNVLAQELAKEIDDISEEEFDRLSQEICSRDQPCRRVFAILLLAERVNCIRHFRDCGVDDRDLPFLESRPDPDHRSDIWFTSRKNTDKRLMCFDEWTLRDLEWLSGAQHHVTPPFFDFSPGKLFLYDLPKGTVLPFTKYERVDEGGFATVFKVSIHPSHHNYPPPEGSNNHYFAVKKLNSQNRNEYRKEVEVLQRFSGENKGHPHLIRLLLTYVYKHERSYHMIFPWADGGNLQKLWENMKPERTQPFICWMLSQYHGIADGLREIHGSNHHLDTNGRNQLHGRHGDIKAENILWFKDYKGKKNHLLISDFGLSRFHRPISISSDAKAPGWTPTYRPPECDLPGVSISLPYDMWTLGCLLLDFLTWYLLGWKAVDEEFQDARLTDEGWTPKSERTEEQTQRWFRKEKWFEDKFFKRERDRDGVTEVLQLKPSVINWIQKLHNLPHCPQFAHDVLGVIHQGLLHPDKTKRWKSSKVVDELHSIWERCKKDEAYCCESQPWKGRLIAVYKVQYKIVAIESLAARIQAEVPSPGSLSPASGPSRASTPPLEHQSPSPSPSQEDLGTGSQEAIPTAPDDPLQRDPDVPEAQVEAEEPSHLDQHARSGTEQSLGGGGPRHTTATGFSSTTGSSSASSAPLIGIRGGPGRQPRMARTVARKNRWESFKQRVRDMCPCFSA